MDKEELKVGRTYRAKKPSSTGAMFDLFYNDRTILWMDSFKTQVQYDGPSVKFGSAYPKVDTEKFLKWAGSDVTDALPEGKYQKWDK